MLCSLGGMYVSTCRCCSIKLVCFWRSCVPGVSVCYGIAAVFFDCVYVLIVCVHVHTHMPKSCEKVTACYHILLVCRALAWPNLQRLCAPATTKHTRMCCVGVYVQLHWQVYYLP